MGLQQPNRNRTPLVMWSAMLLVVLGIVGYFALGKGGGEQGHQTSSSRPPGAIESQSKSERGRGSAGIEPANPQSGTSDPSLAKDSRSGSVPAVAKPTVPAENPRKGTLNLSKVASAEQSAIEEVVAKIDAGGPFRYRKDGSEFQNRESRLPRKPRGYYREYTVETPGESDRGARRIVAGDEGELYYTNDHYRTFEKIRSPQP